MNMQVTLQKYYSNSAAFGHFGCGFIKNRQNQRLSAKYIDEFIKTMAESSDKKHIHQITPEIIPGAKEVTLPKSGLNSWYIKSKNPSSHHCIFLHGGTSTVTNYCDLYEGLCEANINVLAVEYPGYGDNRELSPSYETLKSAGQDAWEFLKKNLNIDPSEITILGYCLGGQMALNLARKIDCRSVILISPISKFGHISDGYIKSKNVGENFQSDFLKYFVKTPVFRAFVNGKLSSFKNLDALNCPIYLISSQKDVVIDIKHTDKLARKFDKKGKRVTYIRGFEDGHALSENKIRLLSQIICREIYGD